MKLREFLKAILFSSPIVEHNCRRILRIVRQNSLNRRIAKKWLSDGKYLPLSSDHRELYWIIHRLCWKELGRFPELIDCHDFNDRIQWLKLFDQDPDKIRCSDKLKVRDYVRERIGDGYLLPVYQAHNHFDEINFESLPNSFVIKTNHDSGTVILVKNKAGLDRKAVKERIENALKTPYGVEYGEWSYAYIKPKVFVEEYMDHEANVPPPDYKFHCVNGDIKWLQYIYDRGQNTKECIVDANGILTDEDLCDSMQKGKNFTKPEIWEELTRCAKSLSVGFKYVRVDLYVYRGRVYAGEMTFFPMYGIYKSEGQKRLGKYLDFDRKSYLPVYKPV